MRFAQIDFENDCVSRVFQSKTPRAAALKAATQSGNARIVLVEEVTGKVHVFQGEKVELREEERNSYTARNNITTKPAVQKLCYVSLEERVPLKTPTDIQALKSILAQQIEFNA